VKLLLICEGPADEHDLKTLTTRVLHEAHRWLIGLECLDEPTPAWLEYEPREGFLQWSDIDKVCEAHRVPRVQRLGRGLGYRSALRAFRLLSALPSLDLRDGIRVVIVHDSDHSDGWRESIVLARDEWLHALLAENVDAGVAIGIAHPEHEAWPLAAFIPQTDEDKERLNGLRDRLGFDPTQHGERLTSTRETAPNDAKRALRELCPNEERRRSLLEAVPLETVRERGQSTGLTSFLEELRHHVADGFGVVSKGG
jgi:hypothetical protein